MGDRTVRLSYNGRSNRLILMRDTHGPGNGVAQRILTDKYGNVTDNGRRNFYNAAAIADNSRVNIGYSGAYELPTSMSGGAEATYGYDGNNRRAYQNIDGVETFTFYSQSGAILLRTEVDSAARQDASISLVKDIYTDYIRAGGKTIARIQRRDGETNEEVTYMHQNHLGSPIATTDVGGELLWRESYTPYGEKWRADGDNDNNASFTGHIHDTKTNLTYMQARFYDPVIGRFLSNDPVTFLDTGNPGYFNRYAYTMNDPINGIDPDGRQVVTTEERDLVDAGKVDEFYQSRTERGDEYGPVGEEFGKPFEDQSPSVKLGSGRLRLNLATKNIKEGKTEGLSQEEANQQLDAEVGEIRQELAKGYIDALYADQSGELNKLSPGQHADYHHEVFEQHGLPRTTFGGTPATGLRAEAYATDAAIDWCPGCD